jgi:organic hydroperoxide reductase OsmC/OhrA
MPVQEAIDQPRPRTAPFPHHYEVALSNEGHPWSVLEAAPRRAIVGGAPPEFGGKDEWWSPEHLLLGAVSLCLSTTFQAFASKKDLRYGHYDSLVKGILDKSRSGLRFSSIVLAVEMQVAPGDEERAQALLEDAKRYCIVANALSVPVDLRVTTRTA